MTDSAAEASPGARDEPGQLEFASRALLRSANRGPSRTEFLREASAQLLPLTGARRLEIWLEDGDVRYRWSAAEGAPPAFLLQRLPPGVAAGDGPLLPRVLPLMPDGASLRPHRLTGSEDVIWFDGEANVGDGDGLHHVAVVPFEVDGRKSGVLRLDRRDPAALASALARTYRSVVHLLGLAMANRRAQAALAERVKELTCMYRIAQVAAEEGLPLDDSLQAIVELLPPAWQHPELTSARVVMGGREFRSHNHGPGQHHLAADVLVRGHPVGRVEVSYREDARGPGETSVVEDPPFLQEERQLIDGVARELSSIVERRQADEDRARLQEQVRHADRLATIGQLAAGVAHELNEPLGNVLGFAQLAGKTPGLPEGARSDIEKIIKASLYAREIIKQLMFFSRQAPSRKTDVLMGDIVRDALSLLESRCAKADIVVETDIGDTLAPLSADPAQLQQVLVNLLVNAIQAMPRGGRLRVTVSSVGAGTRLVVGDSGIGIPADQLDSIFVPFFTTKEVGQGTGLGLAVVHGIVTSHGGTVTVQSRLGRGTTFEVMLPAAGAGS